MALTAKQQAFVQEYLIDLNATQAAIRAGYSIKTARKIGAENLTKLDIRNRIDERLKQLEDERIASATEVMKYLTTVLRGEHTEEVVVVEGNGDGYSSARTVDKDIAAKDRLKAAELLGKRYGIFTDKINIEVAIPIVIKDDLEEDDEDD